MDFSTEWRSYVERHGTPDRIECLLCDMNAVLRGKWLPGSSAMKLTTGEVRLPHSTHMPNILGEEVPESGLGIVVGDPDGHLVPVAGTLVPVPWAEGHVAQVQVDMTRPDTSPSPYSARQVLSGILDRFAKHGWRPVVATELEFHLVQPRADAAAPPTPPSGTPLAQNYDMAVLENHETVLNEVLRACAQQKIATDTLIAEYGPGQFEVNFHHTDDALAAAEMAIRFRHLVRGVAKRHGLDATFMAKPYADTPGNGMHAHVSVLASDQTNIFDHTGSGLSERLQGAIAGVLATMPDLQAVFAPHFNSYRRFQPMSFAPCAPDWGMDNRAAGVRVPASRGIAARLEHRISGADVNPYLALAAILGGMLHGIEVGLPLPPAMDAPDAQPTQRLSHDWSTAVDMLARSNIASDLLTKTYRDAYVAVRRDEITKIATPITDVEYRTYLGRL